MVNNRTAGRHPAAGDVNEHYGVPVKPYVHGRSKTRLVLCDSCQTYQHPDHDCTGAVR